MPTCRCHCGCKEPRNHGQPQFCLRCRNLHISKRNARVLEKRRRGCCQCVCGCRLPYRHECKSPHRPPENWLCWRCQKQQGDCRPIGMKKKVKFKKISWQPPGSPSLTAQTVPSVDQKLVDELAKQIPQLECQRVDQEEERLRNPYAEE